MPKPYAFAALLALGGLFGCRGTSPLPISLERHAGPPREYRIEIPDGFEVRSAGFGASYEASGNATSVSSWQYPYVHVFATEQATGQPVLLVYGDLRRQPTPVAIVRLDRAPRRGNTAAPASRF